MTDLGLAAASVELDDLGLRVIGVPTLEMMAQVGGQLVRAERSLHWWLGDWFNAGEDYCGEAFSQLLDHLGMDPDTVMQYGWVCRKVSQDRRRADLSYSHHREVAALEPDQQTAWLATAADQSFGHARLRRELARATKAESRWWVLVAATDPADADALCDRMRLDGRAAKVVER